MQTSTQIINGKAVVSLLGRFDFNAHREIRVSCNASLGSREVRELELDLSGVDYLDNYALAMLLLLKEHADAIGKCVTLSNCSGIVRQVLDTANFGKLFSIK